MTAKIEDDKALSPSQKEHYIGNNGVPEAAPAAFAQSQRDCLTAKLEAEKTAARPAAKFDWQPWDPSTLPSCHKWRNAHEVAYPYVGANCVNRPGEEKKEVQPEASDHSDFNVYDAFSRIFHP